MVELTRKAILASCN